jgi:hypothetical protein
VHLLVLGYIRDKTASAVRKDNMNMRYAAYSRSMPRKMRHGGKVARWATHQIVKEIRGQYAKTDNTCPLCGEARNHGRECLDTLPVPASYEAAEATVNRLITQDVTKLDNEKLLGLWRAVIYLNPSLHPDDLNDWPECYQLLLAELWYRYEAGKIGDTDLYPSHVIHERLKRARAA